MKAAVLKTVVGISPPWVRIPAPPPVVIKIGVRKMKDWLKQLFITIDRKDAQGFTAFFTDKAIFRFANASAVSGKENIRKAVDDFFATIKGLRHNITGVWEFEDTVICEGEVTYTRLDNRQLTAPFVDILRMEQGFIADYRIYIDISALFA